MKPVVRAVNILQITATANAGRFSRNPMKVLKSLKRLAAVQISGQDLILQSLCNLGHFPTRFNHKSSTLYIIIGLPMDLCRTPDRSAIFGHFHICHLLSVRRSAPCPVSFRRLSERTLKVWKLGHAPACNSKSMRAYVMFSDWTSLSCTRTAPFYVLSVIDMGRCLKRR